MLKRSWKNYSVYIVVFVILSIVLSLVVASALIIRAKQNQKYDIENVEVVEYRLPSLDLEKYMQIDKIETDI
jgi:hypothetical protein